jgi:RNA polymerase sigma factor (sigma-70 family)
MVPRPRALPQLTQREQQILELFSHGATYDEVARQLQISINTVRAHVRNAYDKLDVCSKTEAVLRLRDRAR